MKPKYDEGAPRKGIPYDKYSKLRPGMMCRFDYDKWIKVNKKYIKVRKEYKPPFNKDDKFIYLGDIAQAPGHCIVVRIHSNSSKPGEIFTWYHTDNFIPMNVEEV